MRIQWKLWAAFGALTLLLASLGAVAIVSNQKVTRSFEGGEERLRSVVIEATRLSNEAKEAEGLLLAILAGADPAYRYQFSIVEDLLHQRLAALESEVAGPEALAILRDARSSMEQLSLSAAVLLSQYDTAVNEGRSFMPQMHARQLRALDDAAASLRECGMKLARAETDFLNKQAAITAATEATSYVRRAHGHLSLYLLLRDKADRDKFFKRYEALNDQLSLLEERSKSPPAKALLADIKAGAAEFLTIGLLQLHDYDQEAEAGMAWDPSRRRDQAEAFLSSANRVAAGGLKMAEMKVAQEAQPKEAAMKAAARLELVVIVVTAFTAALSVVLVFLIWRSISRPVSQLSSAAARVAAGNLDVAVEVKSKNEIAQLAQSFNVMVDALRGSKAELLAAKEYTEQIFKSMDDGLVVVEPDDVVQSVNPSGCRLLRGTEIGLVGLHLSSVGVDGEGTPSTVAGALLCAPGEALVNITRQAGRGPARGVVELSGWPRTVLDVTAFPIETASGHRRTGLLLRDVTERIRAEGATRISNRLLQIANAHTEVSPLLKDFSIEVKNFTGCSAVAIRLFDDEGNELHGAYYGFSKAFFETACATCDKSSECISTSVVKGATDDSLPFYTRGGSFYTNNASHLQAAVSRIGNGKAIAVCDGFAHESWALIPIRMNGRIRGLVHVADPRENLVPWDTVQVLETAALQLGTAIGRILAENRAVTDYLTGLFNHRHFRERLEQEVSRAHREALAFSLVILDVDGFKNINDSLGHLAGDRVLKEIAQAVRDGLRQNDIAFRYGGDEFAVILPNTDYDGASSTVRRTLAMVEEMASKEASGFGLTFALSAGIAHFPGDAASAQELIMMADVALSRAKQVGGGHIQWACDLGKLGGREWEDFRLNSVYALAAAVDARDHQTFGHSGRVAALCVALGYSLGLPDDQVHNLSSAALLHDVGKLSVPDEVLRKASDLNEAEWEEVRKHPEDGARIAGRIPQLAPILPAIRHHHERVDGQGYPDGLKGDDIPLEARIIAIADAYDTMTASRSYRNASSREDALAELKRCAGAQFDVRLVEAFARAMAARDGTRVLPTKELAGLRL